MAAQLTPLSASVTRILSLSGFPSELKTRDIQAAFVDWENVNGGFKIKWRDDTSLLIVFADAATAKRAYLQTLASPPTVFSSPTSSKSAVIKPYDGADAQAVIQAVNARTHGYNNSRGHHPRSSVSSASLNGLPSTPSRKGGVGASALSTSSSLNGLVSIPDRQPLSLQREASPTLPSLPNHPTLNALISSSLSPIEPGSATVPLVSSPSDISTLGVPSADEPATVLEAVQATTTPPRIGDSGRRMVGHALGIKHPGLSSSLNRSSSPNVSPVVVSGGGTGLGGGGGAVVDPSVAMRGLTISAE